ncbi:uncharacterized protein LOC108104968 isoform X2 [Drosophila eugracilis]|uniref:uncharacterized protein LOC108104968 isoform X2 n=1 Tax=Drosophila eugracilis TaxID=29029 RepID=UPI0007E85CF9|nr:uncharacterized protein LOC108104968 isoform X2 [Drosophila eugracilis]
MAFGLPIWTPVFIFFLLFLSIVWVVVNREGLLDMYRRQVHEPDSHKGGVECPQMGFKRKSFDRSLNPFEAFLAWPRRTQEIDEVDKGEPFQGNWCQHGHIAQDNGEDLEPKLGMMEYDDSDHINQSPDLDTIDNFQSINSGLVNNPMMDYKREFASDEANPYVESLEQRFEPLPKPYSE